LEITSDCKSFKDQLAEAETGRQLLVLCDSLSDNKVKTGSGYTWKRIFDFVRGVKNWISPEMTKAMANKSYSKLTVASPI
jgi:hypothetical protein